MESKLALTYQQWRDRGRFIHKGAIPFHCINGQPLFREEDTFIPEVRKSESYRGGQEADMNLMPTKELMQRARSSTLADKASTFSWGLEDVLFKHHPDFGSFEFGYPEEDGP